ncbi:hypothetical protein GLE_2064 [Lysobacter enzymogenes]|uniref:Uncharacterized protein n=1 Tax=Lysobacter enzymogenes TaxID=69 RepID=A0A0S2DFJ4_LYSEN|nr:hypothetical protein [Lysobacter enzymogenes]ALN57414.1 hypothetical protein GLE_2064 [Lysobacter enzymogenes]UZW58853.1 hypothetical protein BV903_016240 [Lysobacter enzymogenes]
MSASGSAPLLAAIAATALLAACQRQAAPTPTAEAPKPATAAAPTAKPAAAPAATDPAALQAAVEATMKQQYGDSFDAAQGCWKFSARFEQGGSEDYCMRAGRPEVVDLQGERRLYLAAHNVPDAEGYLYGHASSGLMGAFVLGPDGRGGWTLLAGDRQLTSGSSGYCGCDDAQLVRIGARTMAWKFASGGVWQGIVVSSYSLVAPVGDKVRDLSQIPEVAEDDQDHEYAIEIDGSDLAKPFFPLRVTQRPQQPGKGKETVQVVEFDPIKQVYALPEAK